MYLYGRGVDVDEWKAFRYFQLAADQGNAQAQHNLAAMYAYGRGVAQSDRGVFRSYKLAAEGAELGAVRVQYFLAERYPQVQEINNAEQKTASTEQAISADLDRVQNQQVTEETLSEQPTLLAPAALAESMASFDEQKPVLQGEARADNGTFSELELPHSDKTGRC
jgi:hypothetical protein